MQKPATKLKRTQLYFPVDLHELLKKRAKRHGTTVAELIRRMVRESMENGVEEPADWDADPLWEIVGKGSSKRGDLSEKHDEYLYKGK